MRYRLAALAIGLFVAVSPANAQYTGTPMYCNSQVNGVATVNGAQQIITAPVVGGIFICGQLLSTNGSASTITLGYGTQTTSAGFLGVFTSLTQGFPLTPTTAPFMLDTSPVFRGLYVPPGNNALFSMPTTGAVGYTVFFTYQQNR